MFVASKAEINCKKS